jgi:urease accessory protein
LVAGLLHPISGLDHAVAMVAVGLWGAVLGPPALWVLPVAFPMVMAFGGLLALLGVPFAGVEIGIAVSGLVLGLMVLLELRPPLGAAALVVATFALFHGYAHGAELPSEGNALLYSLAFVVATGLLHLLGILLGEIRRWPGGRPLVRVAGAGVALVGFWFLWRALL